MLSDGRSHRTSEGPRIRPIMPRMLGTHFCALADKLADKLGGSCSSAKRQIASQVFGERHAGCACVPVPNRRQCHKCKTISDEHVVSPRKQKEGDGGGGEGKGAERVGGSEPPVSQGRRSPTLYSPGDGMR